MFINMVNRLHNTAKARLTINHMLGNYFPIKCRVQQGDPIADLLFIIVMESLANIFRLKLKGYKTASHFKIISFYADDIILYLRSSLDLNTAMTIFDSFGSFSGL